MQHQQQHHQRVRRSTRTAGACLAAAAVAVAGVLVVPGLSGSAAGTGTGAAEGCETLTHPLGDATPYTEFVETHGVRGSESEGAIAYGGDLGANGMTVGTRLTSAASAPTLVVGGSHGQWFNLQRGSAWVVPRSGVNFNGGGSYLDANPLDITTAFTGLRALAARIAATPSTGTVLENTEISAQPSLVLRGTDPVLNVVRPTAAQLASGRNIGYDVPAGSTLLVVVDGAEVRVKGQVWVREGGGWQQANDSTMATRPGVLWSLAGATSVTIDVGSAWGGSILAPRAHVVVERAGHTIGQVLAARFSSGYETHQRLFSSSLCLPPLTPPTSAPPTSAPPTSTPPTSTPPTSTPPTSTPPTSAPPTSTPPTTAPPTTPPSGGTTDVTVTKSASATSVHGGERATYTLTARNLGSATATGVVVRDQLPAGVGLESASPGCSAVADVVTCQVGDLAAGAVHSVRLDVLVAPVAGAGRTPHPQAHHHLTPTKTEVHVDLEAGQTRSVTLSCPGGTVSDGAVRVDHVDQGTGTLADVHVLSAQSTGVETWKAVLRNDAAGRAQAKAFGVCLPGSTEPADRQTGHGDGHAHDLVADTALVTETRALAPGRHSTSLTCPEATMPVAPGHDLSGGAARLVASEPTATGWRLDVLVQEATTLTASVRCLRTATTAVQGHTHQLRTTHVERRVVVPAGTVVEEQVICPDDAKGVVATFDLPDDLVGLGHDPRLKTRAFRLLNPTGTPQEALLDLVCLHDRTEVETPGTDDPAELVNTATVTSTSTDVDFTNNSASATITVLPGSATLALPRAATRTGRSLELRVLSSLPGSAKVTVTARGTKGRVARGRVRLDPDRARASDVRLTKRGARLVRAGRADRLRVTVVPSRGRRARGTVVLDGS
ncbi:choice-of-anchor A domain-containing protein/uncharacterized repeat protein (TIGR01451 family) [Nocardioides salarius]|uniref:Choice-of-anchor A domain-containing protein/uncharacterized repeat protein (TIGR01451 family) n=1 Tax=Nocardioides salarius TaxID=374513 RepID=A0ABS2M8E0_9ACTN|nr:choice-of-anchor A family protein [Nocardioides salarius]MBM7507457.1 choice-of-anchor A domain-containing protein/uncharacterized repeat protein (TIGR01451 family) [Nocardioides salarius]